MFQIPLQADEGVRLDGEEQGVQGLRGDVLLHLPSRRQRRVLQRAGDQGEAQQETQAGPEHLPTHQLCARRHPPRLQRERVGRPRKQVRCHQSCCTDCN